MGFASDPLQVSLHVYPLNCKVCSISLLVHNIAFPFVFPCVVCVAHPAAARWLGGMCSWWIGEVLLPGCGSPLVPALPLAVIQVTALAGALWPGGSV